MRSFALGIIAMACTAQAGNFFQDAEISWDQQSSASCSRAAAWSLPDERSKESYLFGRFDLEHVE
jgi:hypothetical protein